MKRQRSQLSVRLALGLSLLPSSLALASGDGHGPHIANWFQLGSQYQNTPALGWLSFTFFTFAGLVVFWVRRPLGRYLASRSDSVRKALAEAQKAKEAAETQAAESAAKLAALEDEIVALKAEFRAQGEAELRRMEAAAKATAARINKDAEDTLQAETERAREILKAEGARIALELAEERVRSAVAAEDHARLTQNFIQDLSA